MDVNRDEPQSALSGFLCELRRRKVYRVAAAYAVVAWLLIQIAATTFPALELPTWSVRFVIVAVLIGFPVALIFGWAFDVGPHGFERTAPLAPAEDCPPSLRPRRRNVYVLAAVGLVLAALVGYLLLPQFASPVWEKSIAVLPFDSFGEDKASEYFADGIQDDLLTSLAKIGDLKVISRTSVTPYKGKAHNIREIGRALGVNAILEGSVRREGKRVRVNVQLINARTDQHLWAEVYERDVTDTFALQSALAREIASQLKARLSAEEKTRIATRPTQNSDAYLLYTQAHAIATGADTEERKNAERMLEEAIALDPSFALAHALLSRVQSWIYFNIDRRPERLERARTAAQEALRLQPNLPEAHLALGFTYYYGKRDYERALKEFFTARNDLPNNASVYRAIGAIKRRQGRWKESIEQYRKAASLDPQDAVLLENLGMNFMAVRDYPAAAETFDRALAAAPTAFEIQALRGWVDVHWKGDFGRLHQFLSATPPTNDPNPVVALTRFNVLFFQRRFAEGLEALRLSPFENLRGETSAPLPKAFLAAQIYRAMGDAENARASYQAALPVAEEALVQNPDEAARHVLAGLIYAGLGRREDALGEGNRAREILPESKDAFDGPIISVALARIHTIVGNHEEAIALLEHSLSIPAGTTRAELRLDPTWDPLRSYPRFQKLTAQ